MASTAAAAPLEETESCYIVRDATGHALTYVYFEEERAGLLKKHSTRSVGPSPQSAASASIVGVIRKDRG
jgi:hypothetical protein